MQKNKSSSASERRNYFRIDDVSILRHAIVDAKDTLTESEFIDKQRKKRLTLKAKLESMTREMQPLHKMIAAKSSKVAEYLSILDKKIDMLSDCMVGSELAEMDIEPEEINLGAGGLSFFSNSPIMAASLVEIELVLLPENNVVFSCAKVISCSRINKTPTEKSQYRVAVEFIDMEEDVRDLIMRHVLKKEIEGVVKGQRNGS